MGHAARPTASVLATDSVGEAWLAVAAVILADGLPARWDGLPTREVRIVTLDVAEPSASDPLVTRFGDPERLAWMHANFTDHGRVAELGGAASYAGRLLDYSRTGRNQVDWVAERLRLDPERRDAGITTFEPLTDTTYIPCVSLLDFWIPDGRLELVVAAHSIDFGTKGYGNLVELAALQSRVAEAVGVPVGRLVLTVKSAHVYDTELERMREVLAGAEGAIRMEA